VLLTKIQKNKAETKGYRLEIHKICQ